MKILNFGSLNIDQVYRVTDFVKPGETIAALEYNRFPGGKGCNQSIALARAGAHVIHVGCIGKDGLFLKELLDSENVDTSFLRVLPDVPSGHAVIQVSDKGENSIVLFDGANGKIPSDLIDEVFAVMEKGDILLIQNEISSLPEIIDKAVSSGLEIYFNPAPMNEKVFECDLSKINLFILNEHEAAYLTKHTNATGEFKQADILLTLGAKGAIFTGKNNEKIIIPPVVPHKIVDTTAAGDTFTGYFIAGISMNKPLETALHEASSAAAICISRHGAGVSIPYVKELYK